MPMQGSRAPTSYGLREILIYTNTVPIEITQLIFGVRIPFSGLYIGYIEYPLVFNFTPSCSRSVGRSISLVFPFIHNLFSS